jgi:ATP-binding cassette, subfamily F, member 3
VAVEERTLHSYVGGWPEYVRVREERAEAERTAKRAKPAPSRKAPPKPAPSKKESERLEKQIEAAEAALGALELELADPSAWNDPRSAAKSSARHAEAKKALEELYARWEAVAG